MGFKTLEKTLKRSSFKNLVKVTQIKRAGLFLLLVVLFKGKFKPYKIQPAKERYVKRSQVVTPNKTLSGVRTC
jgi:hypothetical protein